MNTIKNILLLMLILGVTQDLSAKEPTRTGNKPAVTNLSALGNLELRAPCTRSNKDTDLQVNNVRARLQVGGDIWWNRMEGRYIVPKVPVGSGLDEVSSLYAAGVWLGGFDPGGSLKLATSEYNGGTDYFAGPLDAGGSADDETCIPWDLFFEVPSGDILTAIRAFEALPDGEILDTDDIPESVRYWPGQGNVNFEDEYGFELPETEAGLGNFWDENDDKIYNPESGDFPVIDIRGCLPVTRKEAKELVPDMMIYWIYNDAGAAHSNVVADQIRMEVQVQAFAYATNNEINDMTFYRYKLINRAFEDIRDAYFALWVDPDLGCAEDDMSGCDVSRSLAYTYNSDEIDGASGADCGTTPTYGSEVPLIGTDYFRGPLSPEKIVGACADDGTCSDGFPHIVVRSDSWSIFDSIEVNGVNEAIAVGTCLCLRDLGPNERSDFSRELGMSSCTMYYNPTLGNPPNPIQIDPNVPDDYYGYMDAQLPGGIPLTDPDGNETRYIFPDPPNDPTGWSMFSEGLTGLDTRTVQSSGPFLLKPGRINELIMGAVWVPNVRHPAPNLIKLTTADDIAQNLFDQCFDIIDGPDAPTVCPIALDQEIVLVLHNDTIESNNAFLKYQETDIFSPEEIAIEDRQFLFEGYKIYQLVDGLVSPQELDDIEKSRIVAQVDLSNGVSELYNWSASNDPNAGVTGNDEFLWTPELMNPGAADAGISNTFRILTDQFAQGDPRLVNHKKYYFMAVAYGHNNFATFDPNDPILTQSNPYLEGRRNVMTYEVVPRPILYKDLQAQYGDGAQITRIKGVGVGGNYVDLDEGEHEKILARYNISGNEITVDPDWDGELIYAQGAGPITVKVYNPLEVKNAKFQLELLGDHTGGAICQINDGARWRLTDVDTETTFESEESIDEINEQLIVEYGISIDVAQSNLAGTNLDSNNGAISAIEEYTLSDSDPWFRGVTDDLIDIPSTVTGFATNVFDFIKTENPDDDVTANLADPGSNFNEIGNGYWYPYMLTSAAPTPIPYITPAWNANGNDQAGVRPFGNFLRDLNNVDIVLTADKEKWSRCLVVETGSRLYGRNDMMDVKSSPSVDKDGKTGTDDANFIASTGMSWFPGYAIDVETGKRVNIFFGENSEFNADYDEALNDDDFNYAIGDDMLYNPSSRFLTIPSFAALLETQDPQDIFLGGQHFIYVTRQEYDGCKLLRDRSAPGDFFSTDSRLKSITWCSMSMMQPGSEILTYEDGVVPSEVTFKLRVESPYNVETKFNLDVPVSCGVVDGSPLPLYEFEIIGEAEELTEAKVETALDEINAVPNPYYAYSAYENTQFDRTIKITNVPARAVVTIYSLDGKFIKQFNRDELVTSRGGANPGVTSNQINPDITWDLNNSAGIPVASGVYLIHIAAPGLGERTIKWFGINRKFDPSGL